MRRLLALLGVLLLLFSCATTDEGEQAEAGDVGSVTESTETTQETSPESARETIDAGEIAAADLEEEAEEEEPEVEPEPAPQISITQPASLSVLSSTSFEFTVQPTSGAVESVILELVSGPVTVDGSPRTVDASELPEESRTVSLAYTGPGMEVQLPPGLVDGAEYSFRLTGVLDDGELTEPMVVVTILNLDLLLPTVVVGAPGIDTTPDVQIANASLFDSVEVIVTSESGRYTVNASSGRGSVSSSLPPGEYLVSARGVTLDGYVTEASESISLVVLSTATPAPVWPAGSDVSLSNRVGLQWQAIEGASAYDVRYREAGDAAWQEVTGDTATYFQIPDLTAPGTEFQWQVRARNDAGDVFPWSSTARFSVGDFQIEFLPVIARGETATFTRGYSEGSSDERPERQITLTVPFEMSTSPLTNRQVSLLLNYAIQRGAATADERGVWLDGDPEIPLLGLQEMEYGEQFGLRLVDGLIEPAPGYEDHPAVGITWDGAVRMANLMSFAEGRSPAYDLETLEVIDGATGYRLPTEAEWEYAARGNTQRLYPWGDTLSSRLANYYRSFDPYEDVNEPFTAAGGPTNPVRFFDGDQSPFGIRDLVGNIWEWCWDRYDPGYYADSPDSDPLGPAGTDFGDSNDVFILAVALDPNQRVVRGSAWNSRAPDVRLTNRGRYAADGRSYSIGVRLVRAPLDM